MSWKCDICDSYNEDTTVKCIVCGNTRSIESISDDIKRKSNKFSIRVDDAFASKGYDLVLKFFYISVSVMMVILVVAMIVKIVNGGLNDMWLITKSIAQCVYINICTSLVNNLNELGMLIGKLTNSRIQKNNPSVIVTCKNTISLNVLDLSNNFTSIISYSKKSIDSLFGFVHAVFETVVNHFK